MSLKDEDYARLLVLRTGLRHFQRWSEKQAKDAGITPAQHQLLLAIRGHPDPRGPTIGEIADYLLLRHHSIVELVDRAASAGLVERRRDPEDHRLVRLQLTGAGAECLENLSALHLEELQRLALDLPAAWKGLGPVQRPHGFSGRPAHVAENPVEIARVYDETPSGTRRAVLVDRLWPRGIKKNGAPFEIWLKEVAPSPGLRTWYGHDPGRFKQFAGRYSRELSRHPGREAVDLLRGWARESGLVLFTATKDLDHSGAAVLRDVLAAS